jgi:plasmid maintenance system antidote protein VapI
MTLDEHILAEAKAVRQHLVDLESQTAHARVDYHHAIKRLHAAGGSLREIAEALELSHQRVHQIVDGPAGPPGGPPWAGRRWKHRRDGHRRDFVARFDDGSREVMAGAQKEAESLGHGFIGTEHLMLALVRRGIDGADVSYDTARGQVVERVGEGDQPWVAGVSPAAKRVLAHALEEASEDGRERFTPGDILLALVSSPRGTGGEVLRALGVTPEQLRGQPAR